MSQRSSLVWDVIKILHCWGSLVCKNIADITLSIAMPASLEISDTFMPTKGKLPRPLAGTIYAVDMEFREAIKIN